MGRLSDTYCIVGPGPFAARQEGYRETVQYALEDSAKFYRAQAKQAARVAPDEAEVPDAKAAILEAALVVLLEDGLPLAVPREPKPGPVELEARFAWLDDGGPGSDCERGGRAGEREDCDCDSCSELRGLYADRKEHWDGKGVVAGDGMWFESGLGAYCSRCNEEAFSPDGGAVVAGEVVCGECMTLADWDIANPERAAELRAEAEEAGA